MALLPLALACGGQLDVIETEADAGAATTGGASSAGGTSSTAGGAGAGGGAGSSAGGTGNGGGGGVGGESHPSCENEVIDVEETDVDCGGGACPPCSVGQSCLVNSDCQEQVCENESCSPPACNDAVQNGGETDIDCGADCTPCPEGARCEVSVDCAEGVCANGVCSPSSCEDGVLGGTETGIDCGGEDCAPCPEVCSCAVSDRLSVINCGSTTITGTSWPTPGLLSADGSVVVFTRCIGPDPIGGQCGEFDVMRQSGSEAPELLETGSFSEAMTPDGQYLVLTDYEVEGMTFITPEGEDELDFVGRTAAISDDGEVLAVTRYPDTETKAGRWTRDGGFEALGDIPGGTGVSRATDMSADGSVIVGYAQLGTQEVPFIWRDGTLQALTDLPGEATTGRALRVSDDGSTIVGVTAVVSQSEFRWADVFRWTEAEGFLVIGPVCGQLCPEMFKLRVNEDGSVVGGTLGLEGVDHPFAFRWTESEGVVPLIDTVEPYVSRGHDMSRDGRVIVGHMDPTVESARAYVWDDSGFTDLGGLLTASGVDVTGWEFTGGETQVSADGKVVVGVGSCGGTRALYRVVLPED